MIKAVALSLVLALSGCSAVGSWVAGEAAGAAADAVTGNEDKSGISVDTEVVAGDKEQKVQAGTSNDSQVKLDDVEVQGTLNTSSKTTGKENNVDASSASSVELNEGVAFWQAGLFGIVLLLAGLSAPQFKVIRKEKLNG